MQASSLCCAKVSQSARALHMHKTDFALLHYQSAVCLQSYRHGTGFAFLSCGGPEASVFCSFFSQRPVGLGPVLRKFCSLVWQRQKGTPVDKKCDSSKYSQSWIKNVFMEQLIFSVSCYYYICYPLNLGD